MQPNDEQAKHYRRRIHCVETHIRYLETLITDPATIRSEVERRKKCIEDCREAIIKHNDAIASLKACRDNARSSLIQAEGTLKSLRKKLDLLNLAAYIAEYKKINKMLEDL